MTRSARAIVAASTLVMALRWQDASADDWRVLVDGGPSERAAAASRLRRSMSTSDAPRAVALATSTPRAVRALGELLLDREDVGRAALEVPGIERTPLEAELLRGAWTRRDPEASPRSRTPAESVEFLAASRGDAAFFECRVASLALDEFAAAVRACGSAPCPFLVDPFAPNPTIALARATFSDDELLFESLRAAGVPFTAVGERRAGSKLVPLFVSLGLATPIESASHAERWLDSWRGGDPQAAARGATAILALNLAPFDAHVVAALARDRGDGRAQRRADATYRGILQAPDAGASLLAADPRALDAFLRRASEAPENGVFRVMRVLPRVDASGRDVDALLADRLDRWDSAGRAPFLAVLGFRRAAAARSVFFEASKSRQGEIRAAGLAGLERLGDPRAIDAALETLASTESGRSIDAAVRILRHAPDAGARAADLLGKTAGPARGALLAILLGSPEPGGADAAQAGVGQLRDEPALSLLVRHLDAAHLAGIRKAAWDALERAALAGDVSSGVVAARAGLVPATERDRVAAGLLAAPEEFQSLACDAAGSLASSEFVVARVRELVARRREAARSQVERIARLLAAHFAALDRPGRVRLLEALATSSPKARAGNPGLDPPALSDPRSALVRARVADVTGLLVLSGHFALVEAAFVSSRGSQGLLVPALIAPAFDRGVPFPPLDEVFDR